MKALVIDDSLVVQQRLRGLLFTECGFTSITQKHNGREDLDEIINHHNDYKVVFLDWFMPELDGYEVLLEVQKLGIDIPIIVMPSLSIYEKS